MIGTDHLYRQTIKARAPARPIDIIKNQISRRTIFDLDYSFVRGDL